MIKGCLIVYEYSYFCLQGRGNSEDLILPSIKQYEESGTQAKVFLELQQMLQDDDDVPVQELILDLVLRNCMCKLMVFDNST